MKTKQHTNTGDITIQNCLCCFTLVHICVFDVDGLHISTMGNTKTIRILWSHVLYVRFLPHQCTKFNSVSDVSVLTSTFFKEEIYLKKILFF